MFSFQFTLELVSYHTSSWTSKNVYVHNVLFQHGWVVFFLSLAAKAFNSRDIVTTVECRLIWRTLTDKESQLYTILKRAHYKIRRSVNETERKKECLRLFMLVSYFYGAEMYVICASKECYQCKVHNSGRLKEDGFLWLAHDFNSHKVY